MTKNIGIFTLYPRFNYGGILQCAALYHFLKQNGFNPILINGPSRYRSLRKEVIKTVLEKIPLQDIKGLRSNYKKECFHRPFIDLNIPNKTEKFYSQKMLFSIAEKYNLDAVIVGSDQVWRMDYIKGGYYQNYFLNFINIPSVKKIAYSASFGKNTWNDLSFNDEISQLLKQFHAISVREASGIEICKQQFDIDNVCHTLDPTLLVDPQLYDEFIAQTDYELEDNLLVTYILDSSASKTRVIESVKNQLDDVNIFDLNDNNIDNLLISLPIWLKAFKQAKFIVTDSFHGMVFSIIFNKPFLVIGNEERGLDRFISFLSEINLQERLIFENNAQISMIEFIFKDIDYDYIELLVASWRKNSGQYLLSNLL